MALLTLLVTAGCGDPYPQSTINPTTDFAEIIQGLYENIFWWTMFILAVVWLLLGYIVVRYRDRADAPEPQKILGHLGLEIGWTIGPALIVVAIAIPTIQAVFATQRSLGDDALVVEVTGHRFWWEFHYPEQGVWTANELHLPVGRPVTLRLASDDVIHSFWVPRLGGKRDVNPVVAVREGRSFRYNYLYFTPFEEGTFYGQCAEFCGDSHALMGLQAVVQSAEDFQTWVDDWHAASGAVTANGTVAPAESGDPAALSNPASGPEGGVALASIDGAAGPSSQPAAQDPLIEEGWRVFHEQSYCGLCHAVEPAASRAGMMGPNLTRFGARSTLAARMLENNEENLVRWIMDPEVIKPGAQMPGVERPAVGKGGIEYAPTGLNEEQVRAVAAYLLSLR